jgi:hypothetical protein
VSESNQAKMRALECESIEGILVNMQIQWTERLDSLWQCIEKHSRRSLYRKCCFEDNITSSD